MVRFEDLIPPRTAPRFPYYLCPTVSTWFRTPVNKLIWSLSRNALVPAEAKDVDLALKAAKQGIHLECNQWLRNPIDPKRSLIEQVQYQPDRLGDPAVITRVLDLLLSGRRAGRVEAERILAAAVRRHSGGPLELQPDKPNDWVTGLPRRRALRRERLASALSIQEKIWKVLIAKPKLSSRATLPHIRAAGTNVTEKTVREAGAALKDYLHLLATSPMAAASAVKLYGKRWVKEEVALETIREAADWLMSERES